MGAHNIPVICYDLAAVSRFFRSVGLSVAMQKYVKVEWKDNRDSTVLNVIYGVMFWKGGPGTVEVDLGSRREIEAEAVRLHAHYLMAWVDKVAHGGPKAGNAYVDHMAGIRDFARRSIDSTFRDAAQINSEIARDTQAAIVALARIKLAAAVGVALIGAGAGVAFVAAAAGGVAGGAGLTIAGLEAGAGAFTFGATGAGFSMTNSIIKNWEEGPGAQIAAVTTDGTKYMAGEIAGHGAGHNIDKALAGQAHSEQVIKSAEGQIAKYSKRLQEEALRKAAKKKATSIVAGSQAKIASEAVQLGKAGNLLKIAKAGGMLAPVFFAGWDILDAFGDYGDTMKAVGR